ncbi:MAG: hypothetical protein KIS66_02180 [Fimbriimonadaceae bacterium]|nr:hypothetical protein [Fimbriimonadaceae bacterium]
MSGIGAVAVDLGASSARFAAGRLRDGRIEFEIVRQVAHQATERNGRLEWDGDRLFDFCRDAVRFAEATFECASLGIDSWGVDHGFHDLDTGATLGNPVCYRDLSHARAMEARSSDWDRLYELTGIQRQPFNTVYQLAARGAEDPSLPERATWLLLSDHLGQRLGGPEHYEFSQASTTQLMGLDGDWCDEAFAIAGWPIPAFPPTLPGRILAQVGDRVELVSVGTHDTASAVCGLGALDHQTLFVNVGTWSLVGVVVDRPIVTEASRAANLTNERTVDGRVRLLKNVPGFYVINRLHEELGIGISVPSWLASANLDFRGRIDVLDEAFFNPASMVETCLARSSESPTSGEDWAGLALSSLVDAIAAVPAELEGVTGRRVARIRVGGGGSQSPAFCRRLASATGLPVLAGPAEATVLGNLAMQFLATGLLGDFAELSSVIEASAQPLVYER